MKRRSRYPRRTPQRHPGNETAPRATKDDVAQLIEQVGFPYNRGDIEDFPSFVPVLVREARLFGLPIPPWLAAAAGFPAPPPPLRLVLGGRRDADVIGTEHQTPRVRR